MSTTGKASSFALAVRHVIDGDQTALKAKDIHYSALDDDHCRLVTVLFIILFLVSFLSQNLGNIGYTLSA